MHTTIALPSIAWLRFWKWSRSVFASSAMRSFVPAASATAAQRARCACGTFPASSSISASSSSIFSFVSSSRMSCGS